MVAPFLPDDEKLAAVREGLPAVGAGIYLDTPLAGPLPAETARAMADLAGWELTTGRAGRDRRDDALSRVDEARAAVAAILTTDVDSVVLTHGLADAVGAVARLVDWSGGGRAVLAGATADLAGVIPRGVEREAVTLSRPRDEAVVKALDDAIAAGTRLVVCPHVDAATGALLPLARIAALAHDRGALLLVDGSQAAGAIPVVFDELGVDFYALPASTWLLGPEGLGALAAAAPLRDRLGVVGDGSGTLASPPSRDPRPFGFHLPSVVGFGRSCGWLSMYVGLDWIHRRAGALARLAVDRLAAMDGVELLTPVDPAATIVTFRVRGWPASLVLDELGARVFAIASVVPSLNAVRIGPAFFNTEDEIGRFADAVELLAEHTPSTVPPRRRLTVLGGAP